MEVYIRKCNPSFRKSQILQNSAKILTNDAFFTRILHVCTKIAIFANLLNVEHLSQESDIIFTKFASICKHVFFTKNLMCYFDQKFNNYQQQQPHLPFTMHRLPQGPSKRVKMVNFDQEKFTCNFTPKVTIT